MNKNLDLYVYRKSKKLFCQEKINKRKKKHLRKNSENTTNNY